MTRWDPRDHPAEMAVFRARVADEHVVLVRAIVEAHDGLAHLTGDQTGWVTLSTPKARAEELLSVLSDLGEEGLLRLEEDSKQS